MTVATLPLLLVVFMALQTLLFFGKEVSGKTLRVIDRLVTDQAVELGARMDTVRSLDRVAPTDLAPIGRAGDEK